MTDNLSGSSHIKENGMGIPMGNGTDNDCPKTSASENAVNREIAKLLLNLHASGTAAPVSSDIAAFGAGNSSIAGLIGADTQKAEDLSVRVTSNGSNKTYQNQVQTEMALDLTSNSSNSKNAKAMSLTSLDSAYSAPLPASISKLVKSATTGGGNPVIDLTGGGSMASITKAGSIRNNYSTKLPSSNSNLATVTVKSSAKHQQVPVTTTPTTATTNASQAAAAAAAASAAASYPFYPSLASMANLSPSTLSSLNSNANYLLQNLLLGKMQQIASGSVSSNATSASANSSTGSTSNSVAASLLYSSPTATTLSLPASSLPTQPIPAQALALPTIPVNIKPPASVLKAATTSTSTVGFSSPNGFLNSQVSGAKLSNNSLQLPVTAAASTNITANNILTQLTSPSSTSGSNNSTSLQLIEGNTATNIPLLCGQIVAQLNGLLFLVHSLNNPTIELNLQQQLIAIYSRLQEVVAMVEQAKSDGGTNLKRNDVTITSSKQGSIKHSNSNITTINTTSNHNNEMIQKELEKIKDSKQKEEEKIAKHIQEYQRALLQQQGLGAGINSSLKIGTTITPIPATSISSTGAVTLSNAHSTPALSSLTSGDSSIAAAAAQAMAAAVSNSVASLLKQQATLAEPVADSLMEQMQYEADSNSMLVSQQERDRNRKRGRPPKPSGADLAQIYSSPEAKRSRSSSITTTDGVTVTLAPITQALSNSQNALSLTVPSGVVATSPQITLNGLGANSNIVNGNVNGTNISPATTGTSNYMIASSGTSTPGTGGGGKGGKGIRNRVFCGECPGCLQNDDCGKCRYCKDKTKFGGQNRLRQKCLHRRCQMDTHRKRNSTTNNTNNNSGPSSGSVPNQVSALVAAASAAANGGTTTTNIPPASPNSSAAAAAAAGIYSGVDLARLAAVSQQHQLSLNAAASAAAAAQVSLEQQQKVENRNAYVSTTESTTATSTTAYDLSPNVNNGLAPQKESPPMLGTTLNVPKVKASTAIITDEQYSQSSLRDPEDANLSAIRRRSTRRSQRSSAVVADLKIAELQGQQRPALRSSSSGSSTGTPNTNCGTNASDDETMDENQRNGTGSSGGSFSSSGAKSKSRIDKWKAKHEAMLKMAENNKNEDNDEDDEDNIVGEATEIGKVEDEDEDDDMLVSQPHVQSISDKPQTGENSGLMANETKKKVNGFEDNSKAPPSKKSRLRTTRSGSSLSTKEEENSDDEIDELDESEVEIPNIEPNGVCINLGDGDEDEPPSGGKKNSSSSASSKLNMVTSTRSTRHSAMQQQQALSV